MAAYGAPPEALEEKKPDGHGHRTNARNHAESKPRVRDLVRPALHIVKARYEAEKRFLGVFTVSPESEEHT